MHYTELWLDGRGGGGWGGRGAHVEAPRANGVVIAAAEEEAAGCGQRSHGAAVTAQRALQVQRGRAPHAHRAVVAAGAEAVADDAQRTHRVCVACMHAQRQLSAPSLVCSAR